MSCRFVAVVGPSGVGKDSLISFARQMLADDPGFAFPRRVITRPPDASEPYDSVDELTFMRLAAAGGFALQWQAHGLSYGIPAAAAAEIARGRTIVVNCSRSVIPTLRQRFRGSLVIAVQASPEVIAARLAQRGREEPEAQRARLARSVPEIRPEDFDEVLFNDGALEETGRRFVSLITRSRVAQASLQGA